MVLVDVSGPVHYQPFSDVGLGYNTSQPGANLTKKFTAQLSLQLKQDDSRQYNNQCAEYCSYKQSYRPDRSLKSHFHIMHRSREDSFSKY